MSIIDRISNKLVVLSTTQKKGFFNYIPGKVYMTERNISFLVAFSQLFMIVVFLSRGSVVFNSVRGRQYLFLYVFLLASTILALFLYRYTRRNDKKTLFLWVRRVYAIILCIWVLCITSLEQSSGKGISVYCYLMPTTAALLLLTPLEAVSIFGGSWISLILLFILNDSQTMFSDIVNSSFVTVLTLFISFRYYRSMAVEFCDRETIADQYQKIEGTNELLQTMVHKDQLTELFNRHYLTEKLYPLYEAYKAKNSYGMFLMLDIDYFKQYNDSYGHLQGDQCLKSLASVIHIACDRHKISPIRYGGEEFLLIKLTTEPFDYKAFAESLLEDIRKENMKRDDITFNRVTVSAGLWYGKLQEIAHIEQAIKHADDALYKAKTSGRNRIIIAENKNK